MPFILGVGYLVHIIVSVVGLVRAVLCIEFGDG